MSEKGRKRPALVIKPMGFGPSCGKGAQRCEGLPPALPAAALAATTNAMGRGGAGWVALWLVDAQGVLHWSLRRADRD